MFGGTAHMNWCFVRFPTEWDRLLQKILPGNRQSIWCPPPLQDGDIAAISVLVELLQAPEANVRTMAANGLERIGPPAQEAVPALLALLNDHDGDVSQASRQALGEIDPTTAERVLWNLYELNGARED